MRILDLKNKKFNHLLGLEPTDKRYAGGIVIWKFQCDCGNICYKPGSWVKNGKIVSCGCAHKINIPIGSRFEKLVVIAESNQKSNSGEAMWTCRCDCGNIKDIRSSSLRLGIVKSCGCVRMIKPGDKFGKLTVLEEKIDKESNQGKIWKCKCDCGKICYILGRSLTGNNTKSCGCLMYKRSLGEKNIQQILEKNHIPYISEYRVKELGNKRFDFALLDKNNKIIRLIEFDGQQHYKETNIFSQTLEQIQRSDKEKNQWAKEHNIPLVRIPYWKRDNLWLDDILNDKYLIKE